MSYRVPHLDAPWADTINLSTVDPRLLVAARERSFTMLQGVLPPLTGAPFLTGWNRIRRDDSTDRGPVLRCPSLHLYLNQRCGAWCRRSYRRCAYRSRSPAMTSPAIRCAS